MALAGLAGGGDHLGRGGEPLLDAVRAPQRDVAGVERGREGGGVAGGAGGRDRLGAERLRARAVGLVVELDGEAGLEAGAQHGSAARRERVLEPRDRLGVEADDRDAEAGEAERRLAEQARVVGAAGELARRWSNAVARGGGLAGAQQRVAAGEQHRPRGGLASASARSSARAKRSAASS